MHMDRRCKPNRNAGYSLIELIVVISIMAIMVGLLSLGVSVMFSKDAEYAAKIIDDELSEARMLSMSKSGTITMKLHIDSDPSKNEIEIAGKKVAIKKSVTIKVKYTKKTESGESAIEKTSGDMTFEFDKANGSVKAIEGNSVKDICTITVTSSRNTTKVSNVDLIVATGRHYVRK